MNDILLPQDTFLGKLEMLKIYEYYDKPVLFACRSAAQMTYLVVQIEHTEKSETWFYVALSSKRHQEIEAGGIDLFSAYKDAEDEIIYEVTIFTNHYPPQIHILPVSVLKDEQLPERGEFINIATTNDEKEALG